MIFKPEQWTEQLHIHLEKLESNETKGVSIGIDIVENLLDPLMPTDLGVVLARPGHMKCLSADTKILMYDGTLKNVQDIQKDDLLMGVDSNPRKVLETVSGTAMMYWIRQNKGIDYRVTYNHVLSLKRSKNENNKKHGEVLNITVEDVLNKPKSFLMRWKGYKTFVDFPENDDLLLEPYFIGLWLGDGTTTSSDITNCDYEVFDYITEYARRLGKDAVMRISDRAPNLRITSGYGDKNSVQSMLRTLNLIGDKHIPHQYLYNSIENRLQLLAGLIDSDGTLSQNQYVIMQKSEKLCKQIKFLCDSLGFRTSLYPQQVKVNDEYRIYYTLNISGNISIIPVKIKRKQAKTTNRNDWRVTGIKIEQDKVDNYYGFELDGDGLFLLEDMTVTHNTSFAAHMLRRASLQYKENPKLYAPPVFISAEMAIEQIALRALSNFTAIDSRLIRNANEHLDWKFLHSSVDSMAEQYPSIYIGSSMYIRNKNKRRLDIEFIEESCNDICDTYGVPPALIDIDYLQRLTMRKGGSDRRVLVSEIVERCKDLALDLNTAVLLCCQANREVDKLPFPIPNSDHAMETSNVEQTADWMVSGMRPAKIWKEGQIIPKTKDNIIVTKNLFFLHVIKQRQADSNTGYWLEFEPTIGELSNLEERYQLEDV